MRKRHHTKFWLIFEKQICTCFENGRKCGMGDVILELSDKGQGRLPMRNVRPMRFHRNKNRHTDIDICMLIKSHHGPKVVSTDQPFDLQRSPKVLITMTNKTFGNLCRSNGGSYDLETFDQHANINHFHQYRTGAVFP